MPNTGCALLKMHGMTSRRTTVAFLVALVAVTLPAHAHKVIGISDGDTLTLLVDRQPLKIRLANIDAPEKSQPFGQRSKQSLSDLCFKKDATYQVQDTDRYGRAVAIVMCSGVQVNRMQVERGMAWVYSKYNKDPSLPQLQANAMAAHRGLWNDKFPTSPWDFRHGTVSEKSSDSTCYTGPRGGRYRVVNGHKRYGC